MVFQFQLSKAAANSIKVSMQLICPSGSCVSWTTGGIVHRQVAFGMSVRTGSCMMQWRWRAKSGGGSWGWPVNIFGALSVRNITSNAEDKPPICTADELHYVSVPGTEWQLALWRYVPSPEVPMCSLFLSLTLSLSHGD